MSRGFAIVRLGRGSGWIDGCLRTVMARDLWGKAKRFAIERSIEISAGETALVVLDSRGIVG